MKDRCGAHSWGRRFAVLIALVPCVLTATPSLGEYDWFDVWLGADTVPNERLPLPPVIEVGRMIAVPPGTSTYTLRRWRYHRARPEITLRRDKKLQAVALEGSWQDWPFRGRAARLIIDAGTVRNVEFWVNDPAMTRDLAPVPTELRALLHTAPSFVRRARCHTSRARMEADETIFATLFVRNEDVPPFGTGLRVGEGWLEFGDTEEPSWLRSCEDPYAFFGYTIGMRESAARSVWLPIDGRRRRVSHRSDGLRVRTVFPHHHRRLLDARVDFDGERRVARIDVARFTRRKNVSVAESEQAGACHRTYGMSCYAAYRQQHLAEIERAECPDYLTEFTARWGEPLTRYEASAGRERAVWLDEEAGIAVAAEQSSEEGCTEISFTMRRMTGSMGTGAPDALYERIREKQARKR